MRLKRIEIQGFKSFDDKTVLQFDDNITCIVGPNGCGKSNVVDAIRWVMGEQSAKHLRGRSMEDIIFAGSDSRSPNSLASVEFTFETTGQCPPQYADLKEISIGRKLYRSGESEYFINRQPVRRKDVTDLFLGTGVGMRAYSIIEQGRVGKVIAAKPEERRVIIEEVAGISKFKLRKDAAERRMESTKQNLFRLNDIIQELDRQKGSLERQAKKAERFQVIKEELTELDFQLAALNYQKYGDEQNGLLENLKELDTQEVSLSSDLSQADTSIDNQRIELTEVESAVSECQQQLFDWENSLRVCEGSLQNYKQDLERCEGRMSQGMFRVQKDRQQLDGNAKDLINVDQKLLDTDLQVHSKEQAIEEIATDFAETESHSEKLFATLEAAREDKQSATNRLSQIHTQRENLESRVQELTQSKEENDQNLKQLTRRYEELQSLLKQSQSGLQEVKQLKLSLGERTEELSQTIQKEEQAIEVEKKQLESIKEELMAKKSRLQSLEELERNFEGYQEGTRHVLKRKKSGEMEQVLDSVAEVIETSPEFEGAVSAILGERMQSVVVPDQIQGLHCAEYLKEVEAGRSSFIPLVTKRVALSPDGQTTTEVSSAGMAVNVLSEDYIEQEGANDSTVNTISGVRGYLKDHVSFKSGYENLRDVLFGDVVLVDDLKQAFDVWSQTKGSVVTYDGEVISSEGILTGGTLENTSKALLEKKREIKELTQLVQELVDAVKAKEELCLDLNRKIQFFKQEIEDMKSSCHQEELKIATQEKDIFHHQQEIESLNNRRGKLSQDIFTLQQSIEEAELTLQQLSQEESEQKAILSKSTEVIENKQTQEVAFRERLKKLQDQITQEKITLAQIKEQKTFYAKELDRLIRESCDLQTEITAIEQQNVFETKQKIFLEDRIAFFQKNIERLLVQKELCDENYVGLKNQFEELNSIIREKELSVKDTRKKYQGIKDTINQKTVALTEARGHVGRIKEQVWERYQQDIAQIYQDHIPGEDFDSGEASQKAEELRRKLMNIGGVNLSAIDELKELTERFEFLSTQKSDLEESLSALERAIQKINKTTKQRFQETFDLVNDKFQQLFPRLFKGGQAHLALTDPEDILETGIEIIAQPPGKKLQSISLLSGGEQALTSVSLLFAIFLIKPAPFCLLDEVDAPLDDANVDRYNEIVKEMSQRTQFIVITHNKRTMEITETMYGVTMQEPGVSRIVSVQIQ